MKRRGTISPGRVLPLRNGLPSKRLDGVVHLNLVLISHLCDSFRVGPDPERVAEMADQYEVQVDYAIEAFTWESVSER